MDTTARQCPMRALVRPPAPPPLVKRRGLLEIIRRFRRARHSSLSMISERGYSMKSGQVGLPGRELVMIADPSDVRRVLVDDAEHFPKSTLMHDMLHLLIGNSIFVSNGRTWRRQREMMKPAFDNARIQKVFDRMAGAVTDLEARLDRIADGAPRLIDIEMTHVTADIIFRTIFSQPIDRRDAEVIFQQFNRFQELSYADSITSLAGIPALLRLVGRYRAKRAARRIRDILDALIAARRTSATEDEDILASLMAARDPQDGSAFTFDELCEQVAMLFLAGHETSASALSWALYLIAKSPDVQERLHREAVAILGDRPARFSDMKRLDFTRDVFRETLRLYPPVAFIVRDAARVEQIRDKTAKPGGIVMASPWISQRHRELWSHPELFDPDRFQTPDGIDSTRCAYFPFSQGPRVCLGAAFAMQEATLVLASLARRYRFSVVPGKEPQPVARLTLRSDNGVWLRMEPRQDRQECAHARS